VAYNISCSIETEGPLQITSSHVHCKSDSNNLGSEAVHDKTRIAPFPMTLSDIEDYSPIGSLFKRDISYTCAAVDKISTDMERRAVFLQ